MTAACEMIFSMEYKDFLDSKRAKARPTGFTVDAGSMNPMLFDFQRDISRWALRRGKAAVFADCGMGKTPISLEWANQITRAGYGKVLILAPLTVSLQTKREGDKFGIPVTVCRSQSDVCSSISISNYEMLEHFNPGAFGAIVIDESSMLKGDGPLRKAVSEFSESIPFRLACTATPAPNDHMELGNHAEFLGVMSKSEMLSMFFVHDGGETSKWRLKGHAQKPFWEWVASWAVMLRKPSDLGYEDRGFTLPPIEYHQHTVAAEWTSDYLFPVEANTLNERRGARRDSMKERVRICAELVNASTDPWVVWCDLNAESAALSAAIPDAIEVTGSDSVAVKESAAMRFVSGECRVIVTEPSIFGWGSNWQHCRNEAFVGLSDSWEQVYQATRRCWRFGQKHDVHIHFITGELEGAVVRNIERKEKQAAEMAEGMLHHMRAINEAEIHGAVRESLAYEPGVQMEVPDWIEGE